MKKMFKSRSLFKLIATLALVIGSSIVLSSAEAATSAHYPNADIMISSVLDYLQYPMPANIPDTKKGQHLDLSKAQPASDIKQTWSDEVRYAAAYKFCEHLSPSFPTPAYGKNRPITLDDIENIYKSRNDLALKSAAMDECLAAVAYRTACPPGNKTCGDKMVKAQQAMCQRLTDPPVAGFGIVPASGSGATDSATGNPEADGALKDCTKYGLSQAAYDYIFAHRCSNPNYVTTLGNLLGDDKVMQHVVQFECPNEVSAYDAKMDREKERLLIAVQTLLQLRGVGAEPSKTARPVSPN